MDVFRDVEVTPAMIEAGLDALREFDLFNVAEGWDCKGEVVRAVIAAAFLATKETKP